MKLLIRQYVASLRERGELDAMLPDLLSELGFNVISRPSVGPRQYGVDIAATGDEQGTKKLFLFSVKQGDLVRTEWEGGPQTLRPSLDEIRQIYLRLRVPRQYQALPVVICLCFGGDIHESVQDNVVGYIEEHSTDRISFQVWNGDIIAGLLEDGVLRESLLGKELRASFQKAVALVDEPSVCYSHFSQVIRTLCRAPTQNARERLSVMRRLYLSLWVLYVWARDAGNVEAAYRLSELAVLHAWQFLKDDLGKSSKASRDAGVLFKELVDLYLLISDELLDHRIQPHANVLHALSKAVDSASPVDVSVKMFEVLGRLSLRGLWRIWFAGGSASLPIVEDFDDEALHDLTQNAVHMIRNNPSLVAPIQDSQAIEIAITLLLFTSQARWHKAGENWLEALIENFRFAYLTHGRYPTIQEDYRDLLNHPLSRTDEYRQEKTASSTLIPLLGFWSRGLLNQKSSTLLDTFIAEHLSHCNFQLWFPHEDTERHLYIGDDEHGAVLTNIPIGADYEFAEWMVGTECSGLGYFRELSVIEMGHWPILLMACRHYRVPIPPNMWIGLFGIPSPPPSAAPR